MRRGLNRREQGWGRAEVLLTPLSAAAPLCLLWPRGNGYMICWDLFAGSSKQLIALSNAPASDLPGSVWSRHKDKAALPGGLNVWVPRKDQFAPVVNQVPFPVLLKLKLLLDSPLQGTKGLCVSLGVCQHGNTPCPAGSSAHLHGTRLTPALLCPPPWAAAAGLWDRQALPRAGRPVQGVRTGKCRCCSPLGLAIAMALYYYYH